MRRRRAKIIIQLCIREAVEFAIASVHTKPAIVKAHKRRLFFAWALNNSIQPNVCFSFRVERLPYFASLLFQRRLSYFFKPRLYSHFSAPS